MRGSIHRFYEDLVHKLNIDGHMFFQAKGAVIDKAIVGKISAEELLDHIAVALNISPTLLKEKWREAFYESITVDEDVLAIIKTLKEGRRVVALTNVIELDTESCRLRGDYVLFDEVLTSWELGSAKPGHEIYRKALQRLGVDTGECLFIDDAQENVDAAVAVGMRGIHFRDAAQLKTDLRSIGLL
jgi:putative hydrolase of the HAD superfamily